MFCVLYKRTLHFLRSFTFFIKECCILCVLLRSFTFFIKERCTLFGFISHTKVTNLSKKECNTKNFFSIYYTYISIFIYIYLYIYILKKRTRVGHAFFPKERNILAFFCVLAKECCVFCVLLCSLEKNAVFFAFFCVLKKRTQKKASFFWVS